MRTEKAKFIAEFSMERADEFVLIGGLPRSGTSSAGAALHRSGAYFICDEFDLLLRDDYRQVALATRRMCSSEQSIWSDNAGMTWRGMNGAQYAAAARDTFANTLLNFTNPAKFVGRSAGMVRKLGVKVPRSEGAVGFVREIMAPIPVRFVYCAREPRDVLRSNWQMPWTTGEDDSVFAASIAKSYEESMEHLASLSGYEVFRTGVDKRSGNDVRFDHWPAPLRRQVAPIRAEVEQAFSQSPPVVRFREIMGLTPL